MQNKSTIENLKKKFKDEDLKKFFEKHELENPTKIEIYELKHDIEFLKNDKKLCCIIC